MQQLERSLEARRALLASWYNGWQNRHASRFLASRSRVPVRAGGVTYWVTSEQALTAALKTYDELYRALAEHADWGVDRSGRPSDLAMRGLISRRLRARLQDRVRIDREAELETACLDANDDRASRGLGHELLADSDDAFCVVEAMSDLVALLRTEPEITRQIVMLSLAGESAPAIASQLEMRPAAVRQRLARFRSRNAALVAAAA